jgi:hypothetical protein
MAKKTKPTKEQIYDAEISPLMAQIIAICKAKKIPVIADFYLGDDLNCTTAILPEEFEPSDRQLEMYQIAYGRTRSPIMITTRDGNGEIVRMDAIL